MLRRLDPQLLPLALRAVEVELLAERAHICHAPLQTYPLGVDLRRGFEVLRIDDSAVPLDEAIHSLLALCRVLVLDAIQIGRHLFNL